MALLSGDVLLIILDFLKGDAANHNTLLQCALASKWLAEPALSILYQSYDSSPVFGGGIEDEQQFRRAPNSLRTPSSSEGNESKMAAIYAKWLLLWKSIVLSTADGHTYLPYCSYIKYLDLDDLKEVLTHSRFKDSIRNDFFSSGVGDLIYWEYESKGQKRLRSSKNFLSNDMNWVIERVGTLISQKAHQIRELRGTIPGDCLRQWVVHMPRLETLDLWSGASFGERADESVRDHCPNFKNLSVYRWADRYNFGDADTEAERVLKNLRPHTLKTFETISLSSLGPRTIAALGCHLKSLATLAMTNLSGAAIAQFSNLDAAKALKTLVLTDISLDDNGISSDEAISAISRWICQCEKLRRLELRNFNMQDDVLLSKVLSDKRIRLEALEMQICNPDNLQTFFAALSLQAPSLRILFLEGYPEWFQVEQNKITLVQTICKLSELRELNMRSISEYYDAKDVVTTIRHLTKLEKLFISGAALDNDLWDEFLHLQNLRNLSLHGSQNFSAKGILDFVSRLGPQRKGFNLSIAGWTPGEGISAEEQNHINKAFTKHGGGSFDYMFLDDGLSDSEDSSEWMGPNPIIDLSASEYIMI